MIHFKAKGCEVLYLRPRRCGPAFGMTHGTWLWFTNMVCGRRMFRVCGWTVYT